MDRGINELFEGPTITYGSHKYILPPSSFAEAEIGLMTQNQIELGLEEVIEQVTNDGGIEAPAIRWAIERAQKKGKQTVSLEDVMERVKAQHEKRGKLITSKAVKQERLTGGGVLSFEIERRGDSRKARNRDVTLEIDGAGNVIQYSCPCETYDKNFAKGNYDPLSERQQRKGANGLMAFAAAQKGQDISGFPVFTTHTACYHIAVALKQTSATTGLYKPHFEFTRVAIFEALFMDVFRRIKEATIDDYLIRQGALTKETLRQISGGELTLEVIKHSKNIDGRSKEIINGIKIAREKDEYTFNGFATVFRGTPYQTAGIVLTKQDGRSVHILYDSRFGRELPFMMLNIPTFLWLNMGRTIPENGLIGDPLAFVNSSARRFDDRTQQGVVSIIVKPDDQFLTSNEQTSYNRVIRERRPQQPVQPALN